MKRKLKMKTIVTIERTKNGIAIKSDKAFLWRVDNMSPDVAITAVIGNTLCKTIEYEEYFSKKFTIEVAIEHKDDE